MCCMKSKREKVCDRIMVVVFKNSVL